MLTKPDSFATRHHKKAPAVMWAVLNPEGRILTNTICGRRWEAMYAVTTGAHKWPQNWKTVYYNRGFRCAKVVVSIITPKHNEVKE